jgi:hypothetical protein
LSTPKQNLLLFYPIITSRIPEKKNLTSVFESKAIDLAMVAKERY